MAFSIREAAELAEVSKSTIQRQLKKSGGLSKNEDGKIEGSELARLYPAVAKKLSDAPGVNTPEHSQSVPLGRGEHSQLNTGGTPNERTEISVLEVKLEAVQQQVADRDKELTHRDETISDLRTRLDHSEAKRDEAQTKLTALLSDMRPEAAQKPVERPRTRAGFWVVLVLVIAVLAAVGAFLWLGAV